MEVIIATALFLLIYWCIRTLGERSQHKQSQERFAEFDKKQQQRDLERQNEYDLVAPMIASFYSSLMNTWCDPKIKLTAKVIRAKNASELEKIKEVLPDEWSTWADICDCWIGENKLYILLPLSQALATAYESPFAYNTKDKICNGFPHWAIPFENIHYYKAVGDVLHTEKIVGGGNVSYTGVSVNGIGFGEIKHDPITTLSELHDSRYIVLYYRNDAESPLQTIYFCYDSLDALVRLIPQYEK